MIYEVIPFQAEGTNEETKATLTVYALDNYEEFSKDRVRPAILICPGGGYCYTSNREAEAIAVQMNAAGFQAFVLRYHCAPAEYPTALLEAATAVKMIREHAKEWHVDADKIIVSGFSAGGHLAASLAEEWAEDWLTERLNTTKEAVRPNGLLLSYPVITSGEFAHRGSFTALLGSQYSEEMLERVSLEKQANADVPPVFLWHTYTDGAVPVENSLLFVQALRNYQVSVEFHLFPQGGHGLSLATKETDNGEGITVYPECAVWIKLATDWVKRL